MLPWGPLHLSAIYEETSKDSPLRKFLIDYHMCVASRINEVEVVSIASSDCGEYVHKVEIEISESNRSGEYMSDVLAKPVEFYTTKEMVTMFWEHESCHYHKHDLRMSYA
jgi:hypothetical protein